MTESLEEKNPVNQIIDAFYNTVNPGINYANKGTRAAAQWFLDKYGLEKTMELVQLAIASFGQQYAPTITTPYQLKEKLGMLAAYYKRQEQEDNTIKKKNLIL